jgi:hypothetical protein
LTKHKYRLRFFIEYGAGSLWPDNDAAYEKYDAGPADETSYSLDGNVAVKPRIQRPPELESTRRRLIELYYTSLDQNDPGGPSLWTENQWAGFHEQTRDFYQKVCKFLGDEFEVLYQQE